MKPVTIFLPAAGLGERLRPITAEMPKPLLPIRGRPILGQIIERLTAVCSGKIGINLHYKGEMIRDWIAVSPFADRTVFFPEDPLLGTGGALKNAAGFLSDGAFLVHNADILLDIDFERLIEAHLSSGNIATLVTHRHPTLSNVVLDSGGYVIDVENPGESRPDPSRPARKVAYTGVAVYSPEILSFLPDGISHMTVAWVAAAAAGHSVGTMDVTGAYWTDIGTPAAYAAAVVKALRDEGETVSLAPSTEGCAEAYLDGYISAETDCSLGSGAELRNCVLLPGTRISEDAKIENAIVSPWCDVRLSEAAFLGADTMEGLFPIGAGGSDRVYSRSRQGTVSVVVLRTPEGDPDFSRQIDLSRFLVRHGIPAPGVLQVDCVRGEAVFEDLGDRSLYAWLKCARTPQAVEELYGKVVAIAAVLHGTATAHSDECRSLKERVFDYAHLRWESRYFLERFVAGLRGLGSRVAEDLDDELHRLAERVDAFPKTIVHRDFQSQNIMVTRGDVPHLIDYQGARIGPPAYDLASLLWDPYYRLPEESRERLLTRYMELRAAEGNFSSADFRETVLPCRLQRHMQALGAYAFLSGVKGKRYFLRHVPEGLRLLKEDAALAKDEFPALCKLVAEL
jgi:NDP-sugar pyrophosphorylase family protein